MTDEEKIKKLNNELYPTGRAWAYVHGSEQSGTVKTIFVDGIGQPFVDGVGNQFVKTFGSEASGGKRLINADLKSFERLYADIFSLLNVVLPDNDEFSEIDASNWERVYGLLTGSLILEERKTSILRKLSYPNGVPERQHYLFIQDQLQLNGFDVYVNENRFADGSGGWEVQDPIDLGIQPFQMGVGEMGVGEMGGDLPGIDYTICANSIDEDVDSTYFDTVFSENEMGVGEMGVSEMENPAQLDRDQQLRYTFFIGGASFPSTVNVPIERKEEFRQLILTLKPAHTVGFLYISYV